jgi:hypothetical protein
VPPTPLYGLALSVGVALIALALIAWQFLDQRGRGESLSEEDRAHFTRQDVRRWVVSFVMLLLAAAIFAGSRMDAKVEGRPNLWFVGTWGGVFLLVILLLVFALVDWLATQSFARRHRGAIVREGLEILRDEMRLRARKPANGPVSDGGNGHPGH